MPSSPSLHTMYSLAARASSCWITLSIFLCMLSLVATTMMGRFSSTWVGGAREGSRRPGVVVQGMISGGWTTLGLGEDKGLKGGSLGNNLGCHCKWHQTSVKHGAALSSIFAP